MGTAPVASAAPSLRRLHAPSRDTDSEDDDEAATASAHGHVPGTAIRGAGDTGGAAGGGGAGGGGGGGEGGGGVMATRCLEVMDRAQLGGLFGGDVSGLPDGADTPFALYGHPAKVGVWGGWAVG